MTSVKINLQYLLMRTQEIHDRHQLIAHLQHRHQTWAFQQQRGHTSHYTVTTAMSVWISSTGIKLIWHYTRFFGPACVKNYSKLLELQEQCSTLKLASFKTSAIKKTRINFEPNYTGWGIIIFPRKMPKYYLKKRNIHILLVLSSFAIYYRPIDR
jgi:hypothetical protein